MKSDMYYGASPTLFDHARKLQDAMTPAEPTLWECLRANQLNSIRIKAWHPISYFVADFNGPPSRCHADRLVIELDGKVHDANKQQEYDLNRTFMLEKFGLTVIRLYQQRCTTSYTDGSSHHHSIFDTHQSTHPFV